MISGLQRSYPKDKMEDISTSFCFICLLHLANEQGLKLQASSSIPDDDGCDEVSSEERGVDSVADIWSLKVCSPPLTLHTQIRMAESYPSRSSEIRMLHQLHDDYFILLSGVSVSILFVTQSGLLSCISS